MPTAASWMPTTATCPARAFIPPIETARSGSPDTGTIVAKEIKTIPGYTIDPATQTQTVVVNPADTQTLTFYNDPIGGVEIIKVNEADRDRAAFQRHL